MTQFTDNFLRVPAEYPSDMVWDNFDPYLDGDYTAPDGDRVNLYLLEQPRETGVLQAAASIDLSMSSPTVVLEYRASNGLIVGNAALDTLFAAVRNLPLEGTFALGTLEGASTLREAYFTLTLGSRTLTDSSVLSVLATTVNIATITGSFSLLTLTLSATESTPIEVLAALGTLELTFNLTTLQTIFAL